jgi:hypothetical protein
MSYIYGSVEISKSVKTELIDTNTRLEAIEKELGRISCHLEIIAKTLQDGMKKNNKRHRNDENVSIEIMKTRHLDE